jgi:hypothetical protein
MSFLAAVSTGINCKWIKTHYAAARLTEPPLHRRYLHQVIIKIDSKRSFMILVVA